MIVMSLVGCQRKQVVIEQPTEQEILIPRVYITINGADLISDFIEENKDIDFVFPSRIPEGIWYREFYDIEPILKSFMVDAELAQTTPREWLRLMEDTIDFSRFETIEIAGDDVIVNTILSFYSDRIYIKE